MASIGRLVTDGGRAMVAAAMLAAGAAHATIAATTNATGLASLVIGGFEAIGDPSYQGMVCTYGCDVGLQRADGSLVAGNGQPQSRTATGRGKVRLTFDWGIVDVAYTNAGPNELVAAVTVTNTGSDTIASAGGTLFILDFPVPPIGTDSNGTGSLGDYPRNLDAARGVPALHVGLGSYGSLLFAIGGDLTAPVSFGRITGFNSPTRYSLRWDINAAIAPGASRTARLSLVHGGPKATYSSMASGVARSWAGTFPQTVAAWADRRPIAAVFMSAPPPHPPTNPRGWFGNDPGIDVTTPAGLQAFRTRVLDYFAQVIRISTDMNAQGVMVWDIEGQEQPHAASYVCDPTVLDAITPEMNFQGPGDSRPLADEVFARVRAAGLQVGLCLRPQRWDQAGGAATGNYQPDQADPEVVIDTKADYAVRRFGASMFYIDSNVHPDFGWPIPAHHLFDRALARHPGLLFGGEWQDEAYYGNGAPYDATTYDNDRTTTPSRFRYAYPGAFSMIRVGPAADGRPASVSRNAYKAALRRGDILMTAGWYRPPETEMVQALQAEIGARPAVAIATPAAATIRYRTPVVLTAAASDADGRIVRVEYFDGPIKLGTATAAPWRVTLNALTVRPHGIVAKATDNSGNTSFSAPVVVTVQP